MNLVQKIEEWLEGEVESNQEHVDAHANGETHISIDGDIIIGRHECAESLLAQIEKWKKELGIETKKYNSLMTIAFSVLHDEEDGSDITAHHIRERLTERINCDDQEVCEAVGVGVKEHLKDTFENDDYLLEESKEDEKDIIKCGGCEQTAEIGEEGFSKEDWTYPWIDILLCDDCYTDVRVEIATKFGIENWGRIDL